MTKFVKAYFYEKKKNSKSLKSQRLNDDKNHIVIITISFFQENNR